jgi:hypothetical protein
MHARLTLLARSAPFLVAAALFAACGNTAGTPAVGTTSAPISTAPLGTNTGDAMTTFCSTWTTQIASAWPPTAADAARLAPMIREWAKAPALATVAGDLTTLATWLESQAGNTIGVPDAATTAAFTRVGAFVTANCS